MLWAPIHCPKVIADPIQDGLAEVSVKSLRASVIDLVQSSRDLVQRILHQVLSIGDTTHTVREPAMSPSTEADAAAFEQALGRQSVTLLRPGEQEGRRRLAR